MDYQDIFMNFLTKQGLLPAQITRFFYSHPEIKPDIHFVADMLYNRDKFTPMPHNTFKDLSKILANKPFAADTTLSDWLENASKLLEMLKMKEIFDGIQIPAEQVKWALVAFIQSCPLVDKVTKDDYIAKIEEQDNSNISSAYFSKQATNREKFKKYMLQQNLEPTTIMLYTSAINQISKKYCNELWTFKDVASFNNFLQKLHDNPDFRAEKKQKLRYFNAALNQYNSFLADKNGDFHRHPDIAIKANSDSCRSKKQRGSTTNYDNNLVGFCFSCGHTPLFPDLKQTKALEEAAKKLKISFNTLKNIMSYFDYYIKNNDRTGWPTSSEKLKEKHKEILDKYATNIQGEYYKDDKKLAGAYAEARKILGLN